MDSNHKDIAIVEDDMGEGFMDPIDDKENYQDRLQRKLWKLEERLKKERKSQTFKAF